MDMKGWYTSTVTMTLTTKKAGKDFPKSLFPNRYISIDKDVLSPEYAVTNWDQGSMSLKELEKLLYIILLHHPVLGMDICGEFLPDSDTAEDMREAAIDGNVNKYLLRLVKAINRDVPER